MIYKKSKSINSHTKLVENSTLDLSNVEVDQEKAERSICIYGSTDKPAKLQKKFNRCGNVEQVEEDRDGVVITFSSSEEAISAIHKFHGKKWNDGLPLIITQDLVPPILVAGHRPDLFVIRDVPNETSISEIWNLLEGDENCISHISFLPTSSRHIIVQCKVKDKQQALLQKSCSRLNQWRLKVELWFEYCFHLTRRNVLLIEDLPQDSTEDSLKKLIGVSDGIELVQIVKSHNCALIYCQSKDITNVILKCGLRISTYQKVAGLRFMAFLDNLHETTKEHDILKFLRGCGNVLKVTLSLDQRTGLKKAVAYFEEEESVSKALELDGTELLGNAVCVRPTLKKNSANSVYLTNLHRGATGLHLCLIFQDCGHIESVHIPRQKNIVHSREAAVVVFRDAESVTRALEKSNKSKVRGMRIAVHRDDPFEHRGKRGKRRAPRPRRGGAEGDPSNGGRRLKRRNEDADAGAPEPRSKKPRPRAVE